MHYPQDEKVKEGGSQPCGGCGSFFRGFKCLSDNTSQPCAVLQDQEVKEAAILGIATFVAALAEELPSEVPNVLKVQMGGQEGGRWLGRAICVAAI